MPKDVEPAKKEAPPNQRLRALKNYLALALLAGFLLSPRLWLSAHHFPQVPISTYLPVVGSPWDGLCFLGLIALLLAVIYSERPAQLMILFILGAGLWSLWDQMRWQPWVYQYGFMFAALGIAYAPGQDSQRQEAGLNTCRFIVASLYWWSGVQKANYCFVHDVYPWVMEPVKNLLPEVFHQVIEGTAPVVPFVEAGIGIGLMVRPLRYLAVVAALTMHSVLLYALGPLGHDWNSIVWPWNIAMMTFVVVLFCRSRHISLGAIVWPREFLFARVTLLLFGIMPLASFLGLWDAYLSAALYSGNTLEARIYISAAVYDKLPREAQAHSWERSFQDENEPDVESWPYEVDLLSWSIAELNVPPYPARRIYCRIARQLSQYGSSTDDVVLIILEQPNWRTGKRDRTRERY
jgi:hypothetical protein